jgi:hypothetical protein
VLQHLVSVRDRDRSRVLLDNDALDEPVLDDDGAALETGSAKDGLGVENETERMGEGSGVVGGWEVSCGLAGRRRGIRRDYQARHGPV